MAYLAFLWKARTIEKCRLKYEKEKINSILAANTELPTNTFYQKWTVYRTNSEKRLGQIYSNWYPEGSKIATTCSNVKENSSFLLRNVIGIIGGIVLLYFSYKIFVFELAVWSVMSWAIGVALILGFVLNYRVRCLILLLIPGLFSRVGRYTLACYALVLILTGPATNTIKNLDTLSECLACGQEQIKTNIRQMKESRYSSLNLVKETMNATIEKIQYLATKMKEMMVKIHRLTMSIAHALQSSLSWLSSVEDTCNKKLGTPYEYCIKTLTQETKNSEEKLAEFSSVWKLDDVIQAICFSLKPADPLCMVGDFTKGSIVATVKNKLMQYSAGVRSLLSVAVHIRHSHSCCNGSAPVNQAPMGLVTDLRSRADPILAWLSWSCTLTGLFLLLTILRAKYYQLMFRTRSRFDNRYITKELRELDLKRQRQGRDTVLPLNTRERVKYVSTASIRLLPSERTYLARSIVFMIITTFKLMIHMVADYSLYWVLMNMRSHGSTRDNRSARSADIRVQGSGPLAATVRMLLEALSVPLTLPSSSKSCLPNPHPPDLERYAQIGTLILSLWLLALFEPYGLRLRHLITGHYQPERAKARAVWLYYHIIRTRSCFLKYARRKLHREYKYTSEVKLTFRTWLSVCIPCLWLRKLLGVGPKEPRCLLCYTKHHPEEPDRHLKTCETPSCPGVYCARCFIDIGQLCTICYFPEDYGDFSDVSLERYSSDDSENDNEGACEADNKPLLGTSDYVVKGDENGTHTNVNGNSKQKLKLSSKDDTQELLPLLKSDCLCKGYTQENENRKNTRYHCDYRVEDFMVTRLEPNHQDCNKRFQDKSQLSSLHKEFPFPRDLEITIKGERIPKKRLAAIVKTMMHLTARINDSEYDEIENNLETEAFTSSVVIESFNRQSKGAGNAEESSKSFKTEISFFDLMLPKKLVSSTTNLATVTNSITNSEQIFKYDHNNSQEKSENKDFTKPKTNKRARKRNMKRYLEIKKMITTRFSQRMRKRRIRFNKCKFSWKRRKRRNKSYSKLNVFKLTSEGITNKTTKNGRSETLDEFFEIQSNIITNQISNNTLRSGKYIQQDSNYFAKNKMIIMHAAGWYPKNNAHNLSSFQTADTIDISSANAINDSSLSKNYNEILSSEAKTQIGPLTTDDLVKQTRNRKHGFWANLRLRITETPSCTFSNGTREKLFIRSFFWSNRRRKKLKIVDSIQLNKANLSRKINDDAREYRIALFMQDQDWLRNAINNNFEEKYNEISPHKKEGIINVHNMDLRQTKRKAELAKEKQKVRHDHGELHKKDLAGAKTKVRNSTFKRINKIFLTDEKIYVKKPAKKDSSFVKILKKISKTALNLPKLHEISQPVNVYYNEPQSEMSSESRDNSEAKCHYDHNSYNEYKKVTERCRDTIEDLKREIFDNEQFTTTDYDDSWLTESKFKDLSVKSVNSHVRVGKAKQKEHGCGRPERNYNNIKHSNTHYQAVPKSKKATNSRGTNIPTLDELMKNSKEIQINLSKYNEVTQTAIFYEPAPNVSPVLHYNARMFDKACCECETNTRNDLHSKSPEKVIANEDLQEVHNNRRRESYNDKQDIEKEEEKNQNLNRVIKEDLENIHSPDNSHSLSIELTIHDSDESETSCDHEHVWQLVPNKDKLKSKKETCNTTSDNTTDSMICKINTCSSELIKNSKKIKFNVPKNNEKFKFCIGPKTSFEDKCVKCQKRKLRQTGCCQCKGKSLNKSCQCKQAEVTDSTRRINIKVSELSEDQSNESKEIKNTERFKISIAPKTSYEEERQVEEKNDGLDQTDGTYNGKHDEFNKCCQCKPETGNNRSTDIPSLANSELRPQHRVCAYKYSFENLSRMEPSEYNDANRAQSQCQTEGSSVDRKSSKLRRWFQTKWSVTASTKSYKNTKKVAKLNCTTQDLETQTKMTLVEHTETQCCSSFILWHPAERENKEVSIIPAELTRNQNLETQTHLTNMKNNETQYCHCAVCRCSLEDRGQQTDKPETSDFSSQFPEHKVKDCCVGPTRWEDSSTPMSIEYEDEKPEPRRHVKHKTTTQHRNARTSTNQNTTSGTGTTDEGSTTGDWWSPIVERKSEKAVPEESASWQSEWSFAKFTMQSGPMASGSERWCLPEKKNKFTP